MQNNILAKINYLLAKLTDEQYAPFKEIYKNMKEEYDKRYEDIFGVGQNRLYLDTTINMSAEDYTKANFSFLMTRLNRLFIVVLKRKYKFKDPFTDLINNRVYEDTGREYRLTKLLQRLKDKNIKDITEEQYEDVDNIFNEYKSYYKEGMIQHYISLIPPKELFKDNMMELLVVISKDPYDIAGMSTDRRWTSCMKLSNGEFDRAGAYSSTLKEDVKLGTLVAYLIAKNDRNIEAPYARIAIKPHRSIQDENKIRLFAEDKQYNDNSLSMDIYKEFTRVVETFVEEIQDDENGLFMLFNKLYNDSKISYKTVGTKEDLITFLSIKKLFDCDESGTGYIKNAFSAQNKYTPYEKFFSDLVNNFGMLFDYKFHSSIKEYNIPKFGFIPMLTFVPTFDNYYNKVINIGESTIKVSQLPQFFATLDTNRKLDKYQQERYDKMMDRINLAIKNITEYDVTNLEDFMQQYDIFIEFNGVDGKPKQENVNVVTKLNGGMSTRYGDDLNEQQTYKSALSIYIIESGKSIDRYMVREDLSLTFYLSEKLNGSKYRDFMNIRVNSYADVLITNLHHTSGNATLSNLDFKFALKHYLDDYYYSKLDSKYIRQENKNGK